MTDLGRFLIEQTIKKTLETNLRFSREDPPPGERVIFETIKSDKVYFGIRASQNFYRSGKVTIPACLVKTVIWLKEEI